MTAANLAIFVGCTGTYRSGDLRVAVRIVDARKVWDRVDYLITPTAGSGQQWVSAASVDDLTSV